MGEVGVGVNGLRRYRSCLLSSDILHSVATRLDPLAFVKLENHSGFASVYIHSRDEREGVEKVQINWVALCHQKRCIVLKVPGRASLMSTSKPECL